MALFAGKLYLEPAPDMDPMGVSNIVSDRQGLLYYTASWSGDDTFTAKICRITSAQTAHPSQKCIEDYQLYMDINAPLALNEKYDFLITAVSDNQFESVPAVLNKTTLDLLWVNRHFFGADMDGQYRCDTNTGDIFWLGGDDRLLKFTYNGQNLFNSETQSGLGRGLCFRQSEADNCADHGKMRQVYRGNFSFHPTMFQHEKSNYFGLGMASFIDC